MRVAIALLNFCISVFLANACIVSLVVHESPFQLFGGIILLPPTVAYAYGEWLVLYRRKVSIERTLGIVNLLFAGLAVFAVVSNLVEAFMSEDLPDLDFLSWFCGIGISIAAYLLVSGWCRFRLPEGLDQPKRGADDL